MGLDYDRIKKRSEHGSFWTSYADLFLMLSTVFLMLYVVATLRSGSYGIEKNMEYEEMRKEAQDLKEQIRVYNALKDDQLSKSADAEQQVYSNLMDKLKLLKDEARDEKELLRKKAKENEQKEEALNQYQQIVRNIINANLLAKGQIKRRNDIIQSKESIIEKQTTEIDAKERIIKTNARKINQIEDELAQKIDRLKEQQKRAQISSAAAQRSIAMLRKQSEKQIEVLKIQSDKERNDMTAQLNQTRAAYQDQIDDIKAENDKKLREEKAEFEHDLRLHQLTAAERQAKEEEFRKRAELQAAELSSKLGSLQSKEQETEARLNETLAEKGRALATVDSLKQQSAEEKASLQAQLDRTRAGYQQQMNRLRADAEAKLAGERAAFERGLRDLELSDAQRAAKEAAFRRRAEGEARELKGKLQGLEVEARAAEGKLAETDLERGKALAAVDSLKQQSAAEKASLQALLDETRAGYQKQMDGLKADADAKLAAERAAFERGLKEMQLSGAQKAAKEAEFRRQAEGEAKELKGKLQGLEAQAHDAETKLAQTNLERGRALATVQNLKQQNAEISESLRHAQELADAKKNLADAIMRNFHKAGIHAEVDPETGDVTLSFPDDYFDAGQASLKPGMESRLKKFIPAYTKSLFSDPKTAKKIENVEIIGFASPTYKGKYVNPQSLKESDREAVDYNLRLSFSRANSIFKYIFDKKRFTYSYQEQLLPMVKVVGRGYLPENKTGDQIPEGIPEAEFCKKYSCKGAQKVVVKFNLKD